MGWLFKKRDVIDLTEKYKEQQDRIAIAKKKQEESSNVSPLGSFSMFGAQTTTSVSTPVYSETSNGDSDSKRKLAKRLMDITDKLESLSNQLYHLQQRVELIEKKMSSGY